jgi:hypothetical protein
MMNDRSQPADVDALEEKVQKGLRVPPEGHHRLCESRQGRECDCFMQWYTPALDALSELRELARHNTERDRRLADMANALQEIAGAKLEAEALQEIAYKALAPEEPNLIIEEQGL